VVEDDWRTLGLRATASGHFHFSEVFVPESRTFIAGPMNRPSPPFEGPLYRIGMLATVAALAAVALGIGRCALDEGIAIAKGKKAAFIGQDLARNAAVQRVVARAEAHHAAARALFFSEVANLGATVSGGGRPSQSELVRAQLGISFAVESAGTIASMMLEVVGTDGIVTGTAIERAFRDAHTVARHGFASAGRWESAGKVLLGQPTDWPFLFA